MLLLVDPAALGGLAGLIGVACWALGRAQGRMAGEDLPDHGARAGAEPPLSPAAAPEAPRPAVRSPFAMATTPCQQRALEERRAALARPFALAELHAEVSAIRRDERVLDTTPCADALIILSSTASGAACRFIGLSGEPTCPEATRLACPVEGACRAQGNHPPLSEAM
ncbi:MAG: hypothetical protein ACK4RT_05810 [Erythrobacter sp.]